MFSRIYIGLHGDVSYEILQRVANSYKEELEQIPNVTEVNIVGEREELVNVTLDPSLLKKYGINKNVAPSH